MRYVTLTDPDSVDETVFRITKFDDREFGFNHNRTWASLPKALGVYVRLVRQAYCQGDWVDAQVEVIDLSGDGDVVAIPLEEASIAPASDSVIRRYVKTFVEAKRIADAQRAKRPKKKVIPHRLPKAHMRRRWPQGRSLWW